MLNTKKKTERKRLEHYHTAQIEIERVSIFISLLKHISFRMKETFYGERIMEKYANEG